ncbi:MAG: polyribonucleotide nucleotidyltransferase [Deltaproteobacteria bacterium]|nr:polyribonucleotide nucleotidyltransferase [Deltaproteobacteria bacterium]
MAHSVQTEFGGRTLTIETGRMARQAGGSVTVRYGDTIVLVTATGAKEPRTGIDFFPLTVEYIEKTFAAGKIPGGFFKREGRPTEQEILTSRFIDRPIRPLFADGYRNDTQVIALVLSADNENDADILAMIGASAALTVSPVPFLGPIAGVSVGRVNGQLICNPTPAQMAESDVDLIVAAGRDAVVMVEGGARELSEADLIAAIGFAHKAVQPVLQMQLDLRAKCGAPDKWPVPPADDTSALERAIADFTASRLKTAIRLPVKQERYAALDQLKKDLVAQLVPEGDATGLAAKVAKLYEKLKGATMRRMVLAEKRRIDGRSSTEIRPITCEVGLLPRAHGSALFTRGETQALVTATLGTSDDQQLIDNITGEYYKRFMLHYNFPPFSVGEVKPLRSPGRREIGHGALAERAVKSMLPEETAFPYTVRVVSEILESNGSSSMASVCGASLAMMDAGIPITAPVAGVAMGLIMEDGEYVVLSDILGDEDHLGDMDFKVTGTERGITALQMDIKIAGLSEAVLTQALHQAREGRLHVLAKMREAIARPRAELSPYAPKITTITIDKEKIGALIGPGGKTIRGIQEATGAKIDVEEDGTVHVAAVDQEAGDRAVKMVKAVTATPEIGKYYRGVVQKIMEFGAFVEILPGTDGLVHISQLESGRVKQVSDVLKEGDEIIVKVLEVDPKTGKIRLSRKEALGYHGDLENT